MSDPILVNAYATVRQAPKPDFPHRLLNGRNRSDAELLPHLQGFAGYVFNPGQRQPTSDQWALLEHALRTQNQFSFELDEAHLATVADWAARANAVLFLPDGSVRDGAFRELFNPATGAQEPSAALCYPADAVARKAASRAKIAERYGLTSPDSLPPVIGVSEVVLRAPADVEARVAALVCVAARGETLNAGEPMASADLLAKFPLAKTALTEKEQAFLSQETPSEQDVVNFTWRYEALSALLWAIGALDELPAANSICDVPLVAQTMLARSKEGRVAPSLRDAGEILDELDMTYRLRWSATQARVSGEEFKAALLGVLMERHHALNWLVRYHDDDWDDIETPT